MLREGKGNLFILYVNFHFNDTAALLRGFIKTKNVPLISSFVLLAVSSSGLCPNVGTPGTKALSCIAIDESLSSLDNSVSTVEVTSLFLCHS